MLQIGVVIDDRQRLTALDRDVGGPKFAPLLRHHILRRGKTGPGAEQHRTGDQRSDGNSHSRARTLILHVRSLGRLENGQNWHPAIVGAPYSTTWRCAVKAALTNHTQSD